MSSERRRSPRVEILGKLQGQVVSLGVPIVVRDISIGGCRLETSFPLPAGVVQEFRLTLGDESTVILRGHVVHCRPRETADGTTMYVSGVHFVEAADADGTDEHGDAERADTSQPRN